MCINAVCTIVSLSHNSIHVYVCLCACVCYNQGFVNILLQMLEKYTLSVSFAPPRVIHAALGRADSPIPQGM